MSEIDSRTAPSRGRSSTRGGRGGYSRGGPRAGHKPTNGTSKDVQFDEPLEDQGELGDMKKKYASELAMIRDVFPDWSDFDLVFALEEANGDIEATIERIAAGHVSQFSDVQKPKDRSRSKAKEAPATAGADQFSAPARGARGRGGFESTRGGRGRGGSDRGRGGFRGGRGGHSSTDANVKDATVSVPTTESTAWDTPATTDAKSNNAWDAPAPVTTTSASTSAWDTPAPASAPAPVAADKSNDQAPLAESPPIAAPEATKTAPAADNAPKKTWASMFAKPKLAPVPVVPKVVAVPQPKPAEPVKVEETPAVEESAPPAEEEEAEAQAVPEQPEAPAPAPAPVDESVAESAPVAQAESPAPVVDTAEPVAAPSQPAEAPEASSLTPSNVPLTEDNLENLPDSSNPPATMTVTSTVGSVDPRGVTPQLPIGRPPTGGFQTSAHRAAATPGRTPSYQRRVLEQQEAVVMPGHNAVDRAAVQFGSLGINGDAVNLDVDEEREEPETRTQPQQSPPSQPKASLPPAPRQQPLAQEHSAQETLPTPRQAPGLPPPGQHSFPQQEPSLSSLPQDSVPSGQYSHYGRYGQQPETTAQAQKPFDPFSHQAPSSAFDQYSSQPSAQQQQGFGAFSSAPSDYSHYYTADQQRNAYQNYYGGAYGQQNTQSQDAASLQQRSGSGFGSAPGDSAFSAAQAPQQSQSRYGEGAGSGHNTPNPSMSGQQQSAVPAQHQQPQHQSPYPGYPYGHPYYNSPYHAAYQNQFGYNGQVGYGAPFGGKGGMYAQPQGYGMNPSSAYESSPVTGGGFGQSSMGSRDSALGSGLGDYGRSSAQPSQLSSGGFGGMSEPFGRAQSGFQGQSQGYGQQQSMQQSGAGDDLKPFGDSKTGGPSPALGQPGRPGSATNSVGGQTAPSSALPPPQSQQQGFGGYPGFSSQGSQYGLGGLGGSGHQQQGAYGGYSGFGNTYGNTYGRGGWGGNYSH